ncbi:peptidase [Bacillus pseudomycoides]|nr:peptidase [Bacillus pseudomycoides]
MFVSDSTTAPSESDHTVRSGQRDTVFTELGEVIEKVRPKLNILQYLFF